ncbi:MAG: MotA/TolQ/ExbB proton channel family protein [Deltaproteobacteria bacterium]|nr:MotA/TolQ/ExbB proton channel family protein [Deltaproteobacteria bacterium]
MSNPQSIDAQALDLMLRAGSRWVLWLLLGLSVVAVAVVLERLWFFARMRASRRQSEELLKALRATGPEAALRTLAGPASMETAVARACLEHTADGPAAIEEHLAAAVESERLRYERGLAFLGTLGNNAPFVGLFGTVLGIVRSFHDLSVNSAQGTQAVMAGIAEALVATGVGLLVALPAVAAYNGLMRHVETAAAGAGALGHRILAFVKTERAGAPRVAALAPEGE